jgi:site-specific recombinase XerD
MGLELPRPRPPSKLPYVLAREEVARIIEATRDLRERTMLMTTHGAGLRVSELCGLKLTHIDAKCMCLRVEQGNGAKDRDTLLTAESAAERMKRRIDSALGRQMIARRFATIEPVFANLRHSKRLDRFTLRGRHKVDGQWKLFCLVHNIEKRAKHGYALRSSPDRRFGHRSGWIYRTLTGDLRP